MEQTDRSQWGGELGGLGEMSQRTHMHVCMTYGHRQRCGEC